MDLSSVARRFATGTYTITSAGAPSIVGGRAVEATPTTTTIRAQVTPTSGRELERLPEGLRTSDVLTIITATQLRTAGADHLADIITVDGMAYEVQRVEDWAAAGGFYRCYAAKMGRT